MAPQEHCDSVARDLQGYCLKTLPAARHEAVKVHVEQCAHCQASLAALQAQLHTLTCALPDESPREGLSKRTLARVAEERGSRPAWWKRLAPMAGAGVVAALVVVLVLPMLSRSREAARRESVQNNLKQWGLIFKMYTSESEGARYPEFASGAGWAPDLSGLYGEYLQSPDILVSPDHPDSERLRAALREALTPPYRDYEQAAAIMGESFAYLGYGVQDVHDVELANQARATGAVPERAGRSIHPLRDGIERFMITDINNPASANQAQSSVPVLVDIVGWKNRGVLKEFKGANVLYMDGHVEFVPLGRFPVVPEVMELLAGQ